MTDKRPRILLAEDDLHLGVLLVDYLEQEGFEVLLCRDGDHALQSTHGQLFDLFLLDVMLPRQDGFTLAKNIRKTNRDVPILFITARSQKEDKLRGYDLGADDYITKPFDEQELLWKIKAIIRRSERQAGTVMRDATFLGRYQFDAVNQSLTIENHKRRITEKECEILMYLSTHRNEVIRRDTMLRELWGTNDYFLGRSLDVFITKIRKYLKDDPSIKIENVFGVGFIFNVPPRADEHAEH